MSPQIDIIAETGSTNSDLLARLAKGETLAEGYWLIANRQTSGRGRQGRAWLDAPGNFMGSTLVHLREGDPPVSSLSFVAALAVYRAASGRVARPETLILKWPNDVLLSGAKFCGILLEREGPFAVIGIGVNLAAAPRIAGRQTLALAAVGAPTDRNLFAADLAHSMADELARWREYGAGPLLARWEAAAHRAGSRLSVHCATGEKVSGTYMGLAADGALRLALDDGTTQVIHAGDVMLERD
ncbi:biotin--[acetyl-CoA-carboxylase] ligase [Altererythrobacter lauratis]|uniref:biotin--[biotin carboxyl-carrier protein] ligase n=1 Tax=Alteraurantiacibacter lauratis TaxID=2054627 RepID=A0ABV7E9Z9_9SPHN